MAKYINKEIICEAYVHLEVDASFTPEKIKEIETQLKEFFDARVKFLLGEDIQTEIETQPGSLKIKLKAVAGIATLLGAAAMSYPTFRDGVKAFYEDSKMLAEATNLEMVFITRTPSCDRLHSEARTGVIGRIAKLITHIETLSSQAKNISVPAKKVDINRITELTRAVDQLASESQKLLEKIQTDDDRYCVAKGLHSAISQFPETLPAEIELKKTPLKSSILQQSGLLIQTETEMQRYTFAIKNAKLVLKKIGLAAKSQKA